MLSIVIASLFFFSFDLTLLRHKDCIEVAFLQSSTKSTQVEPLRRVFPE